MELKQIFISLVLRYINNETIAAKLWQELEKAYTSRGRHYHNITHLENMNIQLLEIKEDIKDWDTLLFSLFYHDAVYSTSKKDNEEKSAELAVKRLTEIEYPENKKQLCFEQILATKKHKASLVSDTNYFIDADLSILGASRESYLEYCKNIRKEYSIYPDFLYNPGRKKALAHFLEMGHIFKTPHFQQKFETAAGANMKWEMGKL